MQSEFYYTLKRQPARISSWSQTAYDAQESLMRNGAACYLLIYPKELNLWRTGLNLFNHKFSQNAWLVINVDTV